MRGRQARDLRPGEACAPEARRAAGPRGQASSTTTCGV